jgi:hypothetical protein
VAFDQTFAAAYIDNENVHRVLGVKLRPFCAWHLLLLEVAESPFIDNGRVYLYHLRRAVGICRLKFPHSRPRLPWGPMMMNQGRLHKEVSKFLLYTGDYLHKPDYSIIPLYGGGRGDKPFHPPSPPPELIQLVYDAANGANVPIDVAWNMPIGQAYISQAMNFKKQGLLVDFMNDTEREFQEALRAHIEERKVKSNGSRTR